MTEIEKYYNKFKEDHRLTTRHGTVEFQTSLYHIHKAIGERKNLKILDVGAGTGRYSIELCHEGHDVTAVELVQRNLEVLRAKHENVKTWKGNAMNLSFLEDDTFDITIMFGPMYHLHTKEERLKAWKEVSRVTKKSGLVFAAYIMNEYAMIQYCFGQKKIKELIESGAIDENFHTVTSETDLYSYLRTEDIDEILKENGNERVKIFAQDGPADYKRLELNSMDQETFDLFVKYQISISERSDLLGASSHVVDVQKVVK